MSGTNRAKEELKSPKKPKKAGIVGNSRIVNYQPTKEHISDIQGGNYGPLEAIQDLALFMADGHKVTLGVSAERGGAYAMIRDGLVDWREAFTVSAWASKPERAVVCLGYYLTAVNPDFPANLGAPTGETFDF